MTTIRGGSYLRSILKWTWLPVKQLLMGLNLRVMANKVGCNIGIPFQTGPIRKVVRGGMAKNSNFQNTSEHRLVGTHFKGN